MAYTLGNKCAKNLCKLIVLLQLIIKNVVTCFFLEHSVHVATGLTRWLPVNSLQGQLITRSSHHTVKSLQSTHHNTITLHGQDVKDNSSQT